MDIPFNRAPVMDTSAAYMQQAIHAQGSGDGRFTRACSDWMRERFGAAHVLLTTSGSHALDMAARLCGLSAGDEVIMPSYTFSSTANAFVGCGCRIVFVDIRPDTMNMDETLLEAAITARTRVIVPMHYAGVACEMETIDRIARAHGLLVVEDAAQGVMATWRGRALGALSDYGCYSFHDTKNYSMGEGGALLLRDASAWEAAEVMREKGTDRSRFFRGQVDKYSWVAWGSSYLPSDINAAYLYSQLERAKAILDDRLRTWETYRQALSPLAEAGLLTLAHIPPDCAHNAHMFYIKVADLAERTALIAYLKARGIASAYHYVPLHSAPAGLHYGRFAGEDRYTTRESERLLRLPMFYGLTEGMALRVADAVRAFFDVR